MITRPPHPLTLRKAVARSIDSLPVQEAISAWKTPLFGPYFHQTGYVVAATGRAPQKAIDHLEKALASIESDPAFAPGIRRLNDPRDFREYTWQYSGPLTGFRGYYNRLAGYAHSADALVGIWKHCAARGVRFVQGERAGKVEELVYERGDAHSEAAHGKSGGGGGGSGGPGSKCTGVRTADGKVHAADLTICALGAHGASLLPGLGRFTTARCWSVAHVQLSSDEANFLRGIPTTNVRDLGFFFEPDPETRLFKLCPLGTGYANTRPEDGVSLPPPDELPPPQDFIPLEDEMKLRTLLRETFPWMADRPFVDKKLCWFSDTVDSEYCIDFVPDMGSSIVALSGDSGHGFKMMPVFGKWVVQLLEEGGQPLERWRWRTTDLRGKDWGEEVSWRIGGGCELSELVKENEKMLRARL